MTHPNAVRRDLRDASDTLLTHAIANLAAHAVDSSDSDRAGLLDTVRDLIQVREGVRALATPPASSMIADALAGMKPSVVYGPATPRADK